MGNKEFEKQYPDLYNPVKQLENLNDKNLIVEKLQEINEFFLKNYYIVVGNFEIEPLVIESYFNKKGVFEDETLHAVSGAGKIALHAQQRQKNHAGKLYIHNMKNKDDGLDVCLSNDDDYYYSILIKNAKIQGDCFATQSRISKELCSNCNQCKAVPDCKYNNDFVLKKRSFPIKTDILHLERKNIKGEFSNVLIAAVRKDAIIEDCQSMHLTLASKYGKQWKCCIAAFSKSTNIEEARKEANIINGSKVENKYLELAKKH